MAITFVGPGSVRLVTGACMAAIGNPAFCLAVDTERLKVLQRNELLIHESGLKLLISNR